MKFKSWVKVNESIKEEELNRILDKISSNNKLTDVERKFFNIFNKSSEEHYQDSICITKNDVFNRVKSLIEDEDKVICNLSDRNGVIGLPIVSINNNFDDENCYLVLTDGEKVIIHDRYLYNIRYDMKKDEYLLETEEEFYEKIPVKDEN